MPIATRTFRVFVSSTFSDLVAERNALQEQVFLRLREYCQKHGARFQAIDLRWGVRDEAALDQQTMNICLEELRRCQRTSPRPNFIVLLGQRYGWCPLPPQITATEFEPIRDQITAADDRALLDHWYRRDDNAVPPEYCLQPRPVEVGENQSESEKETAREAEAREWGQTEHRLRAILLAGENRLAWPVTDERRLKYEASATHQEILQGALQVKDTIDHVFGFFRTIEGLPQDARAGDYLDFDPQGRPDAKARERLDRLQADLRTRLPNNILTYLATWTGTGPSEDHLQQLCADVYDRLRKVMDEELQRRDGSDPLDQEAIAHQSFGQERTRHFIGSDESPNESEAHERFLNSKIETGRVQEEFFNITDNLQKIVSYLASPGKCSFVVHGDCGAGVSEFIALAVGRAREQLPFAHVIPRFIGATPNSKDGKQLLVNLCCNLGSCYGEQNTPAVTEEPALFAEFQERLRCAAAKVSLVLFLDGVEGLIGSDSIRSLDWLPVELPARVYVIVSVRSSERLPALRGRFPEGNQIHLTADAVFRERRERLVALLDESLRLAKRTLQSEQRRHILQTVNDAILNPLYSRVFQDFAFEEAKQWHSYQGVPEYNGKAGFASDVTGILSDFVWRLLHTKKHDEILVLRCLAYLAASRYGLAEDELLDILSSDVDVYERFFRSTFHPPPDLVACVRKYLPDLRHGRPAQGDSTASDDAAVASVLSNLRRDDVALRTFLARILSEPDGPRLPIIIWSRLRFDIAPYLSERIADGVRLLDLFHHQFRIVLEDVFLSFAEKLECHRRLANYFLRQPQWIAANKGQVGNSRRSSELEYQQKV